MADGSRDFDLRHLPGEAQEQRNLDRFLVHHALEEHAVVAHHLAVIRCENDDGVFIQSLLLERLQDAAEHLVNQRDLAPVSGLHFPQVFGRLDVPLLVRISAALNHLAQHHRAVEHARIHLLVKGRRDFHLPRIVKVVIDAVEGRVRIQEAQVENEGLIAMFVDELDPFLDDVGRLTQLLRQRVGEMPRERTARRIRLNALADQEAPAIEPHGHIPGADAAHAQISPGPPAVLNAAFGAARQFQRLGMVFREVTLDDAVVAQQLDHRNRVLSFDPHFNLSLICRPQFRSHRAIIELDLKPDPVAGGRVGAARPHGLEERSRGQLLRPHANHALAISARIAAVIVARCDEPEAHPARQLRLDRGRG